MRDAVDGLLLFCNRGSRLEGNAQQKRHACGNATENTAVVVGAGLDTAVCGVIHCVVCLAAHHAGEFEPIPK